MVKLTVKIVSMQDADKFTKLCSKFDCDMDLQSGKYYVDAKFIMGIFSLDLSKPLILNAGTEDEQKIKETFADFIGEE
ncbi:HPr family phosphocarrier protein [Blautia obeum]|mgnify:FL=1|uniref:HPr family phosphocarrier protein n=1 Tax=Blautia obeum TaxID=40520 RepID=UPI00156E9877|nr:HPr family phosphocarrier protein [Blautia obeum]NSG38897.1 HPr family phosphocarrier protein [Blautia obeum]